MRITLVTTWGTACGIAEHSWYLKQALHAEGIDVEVESNLHPDAICLTALARDRGEWLWLNYHAALHSQWTPEQVLRAKTFGLKVGITYHDTGVPNSEQCKALHAVADAFVIHEPCDDLSGAHYIRQGIPDWQAPLHFGAHVDGGGDLFKAWWEQPLVGTVGFPFPWKNYELLAEASAAAGWALLLIAPGATPAQVDRWRTLNPCSRILTGFTPRRMVLANLAACDATAFLYANANTGTSGAIRQGIAARKPVIASDPSVCRQFRDLEGEPAINWLTDLSVDGVATALACTPIARVDPPVVRLAHRDRWAVVGQRYAAILTGGAQ